MSQIKVGLGYDIHRFVEGRPLVLGGVTIPFDRGLEGHSDADVLLHAISDAILGALGQGDIGEHFPNDDPAYKDISSLVLLEKVMEVCRQNHYHIVNLDCMVLAEVPRLNHVKNEMKKVISHVLEVDVNAVNIKATTQERLGAIGREEGMSAFATVLIEKNED